MGSEVSTQKSEAERHRRGFWGLFRPDYFVDSIYDINGDWLAARGITALIIDVDNTIMARTADRPNKKLRDWISELRQSRIKLLVVSNNWSGRVKKIARELDLALLAPAAKPLTPAFKAALAKLGAAPATAAIVGDQVFTDVLGGNRAGISTILVPPVSRVDLVHTKVLRFAEKYLLSRLDGRVLVDGKWNRGVMTEYLIQIEGLVQGVGYRAFAQQKALRLGLGGYARNLSGGGVEVVAQGERSVLDSLVADLKEGPRLAEVASVSVTERPLTVEHRSFEVR